MKTVSMLKDHDYAAHPRLTIRFHAGVTYSHVIEAAARDIVAAGTGRILLPETSGNYLTRDASHAFRPGKHRRK
jgi:hypothetical protein